MIGDCLDPSSEISPNCAQEFWATGKRHMFNTINVHVQYIAEADGLTFGPVTQKYFEHTVFAGSYESFSINMVDVWQFEDS